MNIVRLNTTTDDKVIKKGGGGNSGGGGGTTIVSPKDVNFRDYDGTVLYAYTKDEFLALNELPPLPTQPGLICQEWNWDYADAIEYVNKYGILEIGATYITDDGKTRFYIKVKGERKEFPFMFSIDKANSLVIDWGDGVTESVSGSGSLNVSHSYDAVGDYVISFEVAEGAILSFKGSSTGGIVSKPYSTMLRKVEFGEAVVIDANTFYNCYSLSSVVIPNSVTSLGGSAFYYCYSLSSVVIPRSVTKPGTYTFNNCCSLSSVVIPNSVPYIGASTFYNCYSLSSVVIPSSVKSFSSEVFYNCYSLSSVVIPSSLTNFLGGSAFKSCSGVAFFDFRTHTSVPTLSSTNAFSSIASDCKIVVPDALYDEWIAATNWSSSSVSKYIIKASEFNG